MFEACDYQRHAQAMLKAPPSMATGTITALSAMAGGGRMFCPFCEKTWKRDGYHYHRLFAPLRDHVRSSHPEVTGFDKAIDRVCHAVNEERRARKQAEAQEAAFRAERMVVVKASVLDEVISELDSLIGMMEAYYNGCEASAYALIERLDKLAAGRATPDGRIDAKSFAAEMAKRYPTVLAHLAESERSEAHGV
ncbi:hypothetical protein CcrC1_gp052c [Caulobacter phage C1]|nr:hypothetical protein CcrC1_gp052c [Caulobacter phage C1]UTU08279.1 hypothetical protein CcrC2_gp051c [Caulobacter phage C2]UTU08802.1 hypothetical protein CcrJ4_gp051c [Caulobacter phage J4]UTU09354.1 hypothetical protein CcrBL47_gp068c [Caulobacter phage BL47]UTU09914.1 hypothetical protein CcrRB23_gp052c [Caulobacter phage RB23]WGN96939.1 hypothetical protein [Bertelyvirus sp.]